MGPKTDYLYVSCESNDGEILKMDTNDDLQVKIFLLLYLNILVRLDSFFNSYSCARPALVCYFTIRKKSLYS